MPEHAAWHSPSKPLKVRGRFAPSPTGALHFGSLVAALASYLDARSLGAEWLVRIEDLDPPREVSGAANEILRALEVHGLYWDGPILYQSCRHDRYAGALERLRQSGFAYPCACTRSEVAESARRGIEGPVYPGTCRAGLSPGRKPRAWRVCTHGESIEFTDELQGRQEQNLEREIGDFVLRRADQLYAYQLAVVVDDAEQGITRIVRGADLLGSTPRQIYLQRLLGFPTPAYLHVPVVVNAAGEKLSKQTHATPLAVGAERTTLLKALYFLGQRPPADLAHEKPETILCWAVKHWNPRLTPRVRAAPEA